MTTLQLMGRITETGQLDVKLPGGLPPGPALVTIEVTSAEGMADQEAWTPGELNEVLQNNQPMTGKAIVASGLLVGGLENEGITDSVAWLEEQRRKWSKPSL